MAKNILVVDDLAICRDPIAAVLRLEGYQTCCAASGAEAIEITRDGPPDLIILDVCMPAMNGLAVLRHLRANKGLPKIPVIILTAMSDKRYIIQAARLGVRDYVLKSRFSVPDLLARVKKYLDEDDTPVDAGVDAQPTGASPPAARPAPSEIVPIMNRDECIRRATQALATKTLSGVAGQVMSLAASPRSDAGQIATLISRDPILSARVLRVANTAAYASQKGIVTTINEAIRNIGLTTLRNLAAAMGIFDAMPDVEAGGFNPIRCWQHSFAVAQICERLQNAVNPDEAGVAYLVGLCHDLGEILFHTQFADEYQQLLEMERQTGRPRGELEQAMLGITHVELVRTILQHIGLPETIRHPVEAMHKCAGRGDPTDPLARILVMAELYANGILLASSVEAPVAPLLRQTCKLAVGSPDPERPDGSMLCGEVMSLTGLLGGLSAKDQDALMHPLFKAAGARIRLVRESVFSSFDPLAAMLESVGDLSVSAALPREAELDSLDMLVVAAESEASPKLGFGEMDSFRKSLGEKMPRTLWLVKESCNCQNGGQEAIQVPISLQAVMDFVLPTKADHHGSRSGAPTADAPALI